MRVENIPIDLLNIYPAADGGREYTNLPEMLDTDFPLSEDRTADCIMLDAWLSFTIKN